MKPAARYDWIETYIREDGCGVDVLNRWFADAYIKDTGAKFIPTPWGADICPQLGRDLAKMVKLRRLMRFRTGLAGNWQPGFPKWVWSYELPKM